MFIYVYIIVYVIQCSGNARPDTKAAADTVPSIVAVAAIDP